MQENNWKKSRTNKRFYSFWSNVCLEYVYCPKRPGRALKVPGNDILFDWQIQWNCNIDKMHINWFLSWMLINWIMWWIEWAKRQLLRNHPNWAWTFTSEQIKHTQQHRSIAGCVLKNVSKRFLLLIKRFYFVECYVQNGKKVFNCFEI